MCESVTENRGESPVLYRGDESDNPYTTDMNKYPGVVPCNKTTRVNSQSEDPGSLPADTDGSLPTTSKPSGEYVVRTRLPSSHYPYPSLETVGNDHANKGATAHQNTPRSRLHSALVGGVRSMARPVSVHVPTVGGCPVFGRFGLGGIGYGTSGYRVPLGRTNTPYPRFEGRRVAHEPGTHPLWMRKLPSG